MTSEQRPCSTHNYTQPNAAVIQWRNGRRIVTLYKKKTGRLTLAQRPRSNYTYTEPTAAVIQWRNGRHIVTLVPPNTRIETYWGRNRMKLGPVSTRPSSSSRHFEQSGHTKFLQKQGEFQV